MLVSIGIRNKRRRKTRQTARNMIQFHNSSVYYNAGLLLLAFSFWRRLLQFFLLIPTKNGPTNQLSIDWCRRIIDWLGGEEDFVVGKMIVFFRHVRIEGINLGLACDWGRISITELDDESSKTDVEWFDPSGRRPRPSTRRVSAIKKTARGVFIPKYYRPSYHTPTFLWQRRRRKKKKGK